MIPKSYNTLVSEPIEYLLCPYGRTKSDEPQWALGFRGPRAYRELAHNLFHSFGNDPRPTELHENLSYVCGTFEGFEEAIALFLTVNVLLDKEVKVESYWDEEAETYELVQDDAGAEALGREWAAAFMTKHVRRESFMPDAPVALNVEYAHSGRGIRRASASSFESLVDRASESS